MTAFYNYMDLNNYFNKDFYTKEEYKDELIFFVNNEHTLNISYSYIILGYLFEQCGCYLNANKNYFKAYKLSIIQNIDVYKYTALTYMIDNKYKNMKNIKI